MVILPVSDPSFRRYGRVVEGYELGGVMDFFYANIMKDTVSSNLRASAKLWDKMLERLVTSLEQADSDGVPTENP